MQLSCHLIVKVTLSLFTFSCFCYCRFRCCPQNSHFVGCIPVVLENKSTENDKKGKGTHDWHLRSFGRFSFGRAIERSQHSVGQLIQLINDQTSLSEFEGHFDCYLINLKYQVTVACLIDCPFVCATRVCASFQSRSFFHFRLDAYLCPHNDNVAHWGYPHFAGSGGATTNRSGRNWSELCASAPS